MATPHLRIAVLHGGPSSEHDISVWSSRGVIETLRGLGHDVHAVFVDRDGLWHLTQGTSSGQVSDAPLPILQAISRLQTLQVNVCFLGFHGTYGEDGRIQALLDLAGLRFTGSDMTASAVAMDKPLARRVFQGVGMPVARARELDREALSADVEALAQDLIDDLGLPLVLKVPAGGSSVGVEIPRDRDAVVAALGRLAALATKLLCEQYIAGTELTSGVLERADGSLEALPLVEIVPANNAEFFDFSAKYQQGGSIEIVPARIDAEATARVQALGMRAHLALGCRGVSRTDVILRADGQPFVLETNTLPGLTPASLLPKAAAATGCDYATLLMRIVQAALR